MILFFVAFLMIAIVAIAIPAIVWVLSTLIDRRDR
jgi:hypothetical protein